MVLEGLEPMGIKFDAARNEKFPPGGGLICADDSPVKAVVVNTDEELVIARDTVRCIAGVSKY